MITTSTCELVDERAEQSHACSSQLFWSHRLWNTAIFNTDFFRQIGVFVWSI
jgi:hypothetical protein